MLITITSLDIENWKERKICIWDNIQFPFSEIIYVLNVNYGFEFYWM